MKLIVGLGNPGAAYAATRHNVGFAAADFFAATLDPDGIFRRKPKLEAELFTHGNSLIAKPRTYMNDSGRAVKKLCDYYRLDVPTNLLVIHDDVDLTWGTWKRAYNSSSAGHKGVQSIIDALGTQEFRRVRIGIESRSDKKTPATESFVLQPLKSEERRMLKGTFEAVAQELQTFISN